MNLKPEELTAYCLAIMNQPLEKSDAIVALTGDGYGRINEACDLYFKGFAKILVITGADSTLYQFPDFRASDFKISLVQSRNVNPKDIIADDVGKTTPGQARNTVTLCKQNNWRGIILVASGDHMVRAYLTFLKEFLRNNYPIRMLAHASYAPWFAEDNNLGVSPKERWARFVREEYLRIVSYQGKGNVATWQELEAYLRNQKL